MPRRRKRIVDLVRDGTFLARKDEHLLGGRDKLPWPELDRFRRRFVNAELGDRREISLELEQGLRENPASVYLGDLQSELLKLGPRDSFQQLERFFPRFFRHYAGPAAGKRFRLAKYQREFLQEFWRRDRYGRRLYQVGLLMIPKGNGKTPLAAGLGTHALVSETDSPEVYNVAGAKDQASICFDFARSNVEDGALSAWLEVGGSAIYCPEHRGDYEILSSDGFLAAGVKTSAAVFDELFLAKHAHQREAWNSHEKALPKRPGRSWLLGISTAGFDKQTLLGERYDAAIGHPKLEVHQDGSLLILRDTTSGFLFWCYAAPDGADIENPRVLRQCNPAPWVQPRDLLRELALPGANELDWRRLHANQWTKAQDAWLPSGVWARLRSETQIPDGAQVFVAIDAALKYDTTAVTWAAYDENGRIQLETRVWSARPEAPHHVYVPGGRIDNELAFEFVLDELADRYQVREVVGDPRFIEDLLRRLGERLVVAEFQQNSAAMADAYQHFYADTLAADLRWHDPENVFPKHVEAAAAVLSERGWKLFKLRASEPMDALIAGVMARERCSLSQPYSAGIEWQDDDEEDE